MPTAAQNVDAALEPLVRLSREPGVMNHNSLGTVVASIRGALLASQAGDTPDPVEHDEAGDERSRQDAYRAYVEQAKADGVEPLSYEAFLASSDPENEAAVEEPRAKPLFAA